MFKVGEDYRSLHANIGVGKVLKSVGEGGGDCLVEGVPRSHLLILFTIN